MRLLGLVLQLLPFLLLVTTCGQTGDLYLPEEPEPPEPAALATPLR